MQTGIHPMIQTLTGRAGEYAVAAQLLIRGINVLWPSFDEGYDYVN